MFGVGGEFEDRGGDEFVFGFGHGDGGAAVDEGDVEGGGGGDEGGVGEEGGEKEGGVLGEFDEFAGFGVGDVVGSSIVGVVGRGVGLEGVHVVDEFLFPVGGVGGTDGIHELSGLGLVRGISVNEFLLLGTILKGWSGVLELSIRLIGAVGCVDQVDHHVTRIPTPMTIKTSSRIQRILTRQHISTEPLLQQLLLLPRRQVIKRLHSSLQERLTTQGIIRTANVGQTPSAVRIVSTIRPIRLVDLLRLAGELLCVLEARRPQKLLDGRVRGRTGGTLADHAAVAVVVADSFEVFDGEVGVPVCFGLGDVVEETAWLGGGEVALC